MPRCDGNYFTLFYPYFLHIRPTESKVLDFGIRFLKEEYIAAVNLLPKFQMMGICSSTAFIFNNSNIEMPIFYSLTSLKANQSEMVLHGGFRGISIKPNEPIATLIFLKNASVD